MPKTKIVRRKKHSSLSKGADETGRKMDNKADKKKPVKPPECLFRDEQNPTLDELIGQITPENRHPETDWGPGVGREKLYW